MTKKNSFYGLPTNEDLESLIDGNYQNIKPLEYVEAKDSNTDNINMFAFWTPVKDNIESYGDYKSYLDERTKRLATAPKVNKWDSEAIANKLKLQTTSPIVLSDKTGIVKPLHASDLDATTTHNIVTQTDGSSTTETGKTGTEKIPSSGAKNSIEMNPSKVGVVKPKHDELLNKTVTHDKITKSDIGVTKPDVVSDAAKPKGDMVGAVKPKEAMGKQNIPNITKNSEKAKGENVGVVKPKFDFIPQNKLNFDKSNTSNIK